ncbi:MAG TPA: hypothetical protein VN976_20790 [Verrucomicrobiae bacterium]|nr:hypothetical protein [Verrucomicrobiae bacterium]
MRIKLALWMATLTLSLATAWGGVCFGQSGLAKAPDGEGTEIAQATVKKLVAAAVLPKSMDQPDVQTDDTASDTEEVAGSEPARAGTKEAGQRAFSRIGIGVKISTLGAGIEVATPLAGKFNLRGGFNMFRYSRPITNDGIQYDGHLQFQSAEAHLDWFLLGGIHISPGILFYNGNQVTATASVPGGQTFSVGGTSYESDPTAPVTGTGKLDFVKVSPSIMVGIGNLIPRNGRHYSFLFEVGGAYQGSARVALNLAGNVCDTTGTICRAVSSDPTVLANIQAQQVKIQNDVNPYRFFPVLSLGVGFNF